MIEALGVELNNQRTSGSTAVSAYKDVKECLEKLTGETGTAGKALDEQLGKALGIGRSVERDEHGESACVMPFAVALGGIDMDGDVHAVGEIGRAHV